MNEKVSQSKLEVSTLVLLELDGLEESLEVACAEAGVVVPLDDLDEHGRPVLEGLREDLKKRTMPVLQFPNRKSADFPPSFLRTWSRYPSSS